jgi:hypothetical protein
LLSVSHAKPAWRYRDLLAAADDDGEEEDEAADRNKEGPRKEGLR